MRLVSFKVTNFRSIDDSGWVDVAQVTAMLGRNESGKSNLLRALYSLNPAEEVAPFSAVKDFPRHRRLDEFSSNMPVVATHWRLDEGERAALARIFPRAADVGFVTVGRSYAETRWVGFEGLAAQAFDEADIRMKVRKIVFAVKAAAENVAETSRPAVELAADRFDAAMALIPDRIRWAENAVKALQTLGMALAAADAELSEKQEQLLLELEDLSAAMANDKTAQDAAQAWILEHMPQFIYVDEYPELRGHQNIAEYLARKDQGQMTTTDRNFEKLCKVAGLDPRKLHDLLNENDQETRNQLANRAGSAVTMEIRRLWKDRALKVRFNLDAHHLDTLVSDPNAVYEVEVNLDERSKGFQWFFSFYITFFADTKGGHAEDAIILFDEPGLYLHARSQHDLLGHFEKDFTNQIIYTTHSPFMVPAQRLDSVRTVVVGETTGTTVSNTLRGDARTLFPLQAALGYNIARNLFAATDSLVVESLTDYWLLTAASAILSERGMVALDAALTVTPAGGAHKVAYLAALLTSEEQNVLLLLGRENDDRLKSKLIAGQNVVFIAEAFAAPAPVEADVEDLLDPAVYEALVGESYAVELAGRTLGLNPAIPRIVKRVAAALAELGLKFDKARPARLLLKKMACDPAPLIPAASAQRFEALFKAINERLAEHSARSLPRVG